MNDDSTQRWSERYLGVAQRFIPVALQQDAAQAARAANVVNAAVMAGTAGPLYALAYWLLGLETAAYSSLNYLCELPVDILKMDGLFVRRLGAASGRARAYAIADSIVAMAHRLGLVVIAESVETAQQLGDLCAMGVDAAQGYLFDRPLAPDLVAALLARQAREFANAPPPSPRILESVNGERRAI